VIAVDNSYFGPTVTTAGLLPGRDVLSAVRAAGPSDLVLLPAEALNEDDRFVDDVALSDVVSALAPAQVRPAWELTAALVTP
jgi:NifB/MoaA-like Fe-S oxidoreductase